LKHWKKLPYNYLDKKYILKTGAGTLLIHEEKKNG